MYTIYFMLYLIEILHQTTTSSHSVTEILKLYLIEILHQTTTNSLEFLLRIRLYLIEILHQTTTYRSMSSLFRPLYLIEILHQTTTNRNFRLFPLLLYLIEILHQTTTRFCILFPVYRCILSKFYIKPQLFERHPVETFVVSYRNSTSNHNPATSSFIVLQLYLIEILHQTTTDGWILVNM